jgi:hypothetical protein
MLATGAPAALGKQSSPNALGSCSTRDPLARIGICATPQEVTLPASLVPPITLGDLIGMVETFPFQFPTIRPSSEAIQFAIAATVLRVFVGDAWCDNNLRGAEGADPHLVPRSPSSTDRMRIQARIVALAELVFNLQNVPGARQRFHRLKNDSVETAVADLEAARLLTLSEICFRFVPEQQKKGKDYDIELTLEDGGPICCESKCKVEATTISKTSLLNSLKKAARQLPNALPGVVFVKVPETWISDPNMRVTAETALAEFFRNTGRIVEVIFHWEEWQRLEAGPLLRLASFREEVNENSRFYRPSLVNFLRPFSPLWRPPTWRGLRDVVEMVHTQVHANTRLQPTRYPRG